MEQARSQEREKDKGRECKKEMLHAVGVNLVNYYNDRYNVCLISAKIIMVEKSAVAFGRLKYIV